jgi:hypothetical protein
MEPLKAEDFDDPELNIEPSFLSRMKKAAPEQAVEPSSKKDLDFDSLGNFDNDLDSFNFDLTVIPDPVPYLPMIMCGF